MASDSQAQDYLVQFGGWKRAGCICRIDAKGRVQSCSFHGSAARKAEAEAILAEAREWALCVLEVKPDGR